AAIEAANALEFVVRNGGEALSFAFTGATAFSMLGASIAGATFAARVLGISLKGALIGSGIGVAVIGLGASVGTLIAFLNQIRGKDEPIHGLSNAAKAGIFAFTSLGVAITGASVALRAFGMTVKGVLIGSGVGVAILGISAAFAGLLAVVGY